MHHICYCYEAVQVLNDNVMFMQQNITCRYEAIQVLKDDIIQIHKNMDLMVMRDSVYEQQ